MRFWIVFVMMIAALLSVCESYADEKKETVIEKFLDSAASPLRPVTKFTTLDKIVVAPSRVEERLGSASCSVSVQDTEDFERKEVYLVKDTLKDEVGIDVRQSGAFQGDTSILMRGGNSNQTLIMIDGMKAYDPISPGGSYNIANLTLDNVDQIEILRGPQSALYGSDAMAGVISVSTKKAMETYARVSYEGGSFFTNQEQFEIGSVTHGLHYTFAGSQFNTKGISQAEAKANCQERDTYDRTSLAGRIDYDINDRAAVGGTVRWTQAHYAFDQGANTDDDNAFSFFREAFVTLFADQELMKRWSHHIKLGWMQTMRQYFDDNSPVAFDFDRSKYFGKSFKLDYQNTIEAHEFDKIVIGYEYTDESAQFYSQNNFSGFMTNDIMSEVSANEGDLYLENRINIHDRFTSTQGMRVIHHTRAGTHMVYRFDASYLFFTGTKVRGLIATGFKAPSLYQLFAPANAFFGGGNANLNPEKSASYEFGMDQFLFDEKILASVTYFHTVYRDLVDALTDPNTFFTAAYANIGKTQVHGIEANVTIKPIDTVKVIWGFTYQSTKDFQNDQELIRRPARKFYLETFWQATKKLSFDLRTQYNGPMSDNLSNPAWALNTYKVKEFIVFDSVVNYDINKNFSVYLKTDNIFNKHYEEVRGYGTTPFSMYGGVKAKF